MTVLTNTEYFITNNDMAQKSVINSLTNNSVNLIYSCGILQNVLGVFDNAYIYI